MSAGVFSSSVIGIIYSVILTYFLLGGVSFYFINRNKPREIARESYIKFGSYFVIITLLFFSIVLRPVLFTGIALVIVAVGMWEMIRVYQSNPEDKGRYFIFSLLVFMLLAGGFILFSRLNPALILYTFLILSIFDSFSQISGQLFGKKKLIPNISPNKTVGGLIGGLVVAIISGFFMQTIYGGEGSRMIILLVGIVLFAFGGDVGASWYKRVFGVKDYSSLIPGHGGFLDRFDSLIAGGCWVMIWYLMLG